MIRKNGFSKSDPLLIGFLTVLLVLICLPRFDRRDLGLIGGLTTDGKAATEQLYDASYYVEYLELFRGIPAKSHKSPFIYRPLVPFLGSLLPFKPMTSINIVNLAFLFIGCALSHLTLLFVGCRRNLSFRTALRGFFPVFYYGTIGLVDPAANRSSLSLLILGTEREVDSSSSGFGTRDLCQRDSCHYCSILFRVLAPFQTNKSRFLVVKIHHSGCICLWFDVADKSNFTRHR